MLKIADENISALRFAICKSCDDFNKTLNTCKICNCFMQVKTKLAESSCPVKRWSAVEEKQTEQPQQ
jgi:hypothetical protein